ncbi:MAG: hypothetical protein ACI9SG_002173, partial [Maribacter sp.]
ASKSYTDYHYSIALGYVNVLRHRVQQGRVMDHQLAR